MTQPPPSWLIAVATIIQSPSAQWMKAVKLPLNTLIYINFCCRTASTKLFRRVPGTRRRAKWSTPGPRVRSTWSGHSRIRRNRISSWHWRDTSRPPTSTWATWWPERWNAVRRRAKDRSNWRTSPSSDDTRIFTIETIQVTHLLHMIFESDANRTKLGFF